MAPKAGIQVRGATALVSAMNQFASDFGGDSAYTVEATADHAEYQEHGTRYHRAQPFMGPGAAAAQSRIKTTTRRASSSDEIARLVAEDAANEARSRAPVDTGELRDSITVSKA